MPFSNEASELGLVTYSMSINF